MSADPFRDLGIRRCAQQGVFLWSEKPPAWFGHANSQADTAIFYRTECSAKFFGDVFVVLLVEEGVLIGGPLTADNLPDPQHPPPDEDGCASALKLARRIIAENVASMLSSCLVQGRFLTCCGQTALCKVDLRRATALTVAPISKAT